MEMSDALQDWRPEAHWMDVICDSDASQAEDATRADR
jgi:hypothetical protein